MLAFGAAWASSARKTALWSRRLIYTCSAKFYIEKEIYAFESAPLNFTRKLSAQILYVQLCDLSLLNLHSGTVCAHTENKILRRRLIQASRDAKIAIDTKYFASRRDDAKRNLRTPSKGIYDEILNLR